MSGNQSTSSSEGGPLGALSFIPALLGSAFFGTGLKVKDGAFKITGENASDKGAVFGFGEGPLSGELDPGSLLRNILDQLSPDFNTGVAGARDFLGSAGAIGQNVLGTTDQALSTLGEGLETGFKADLDPIIEASKRDLFQNIIPEIGERFNVVNEGIGGFSSDFGGQLVDAGTDLSTNLGALETQLQTQAGQTRSQLAGISGTLLNQLGGQPFNLAQQSMDTGAQLALEGTAAGRQTQLLSLLTGQINPVQGSQQGGSSQGKSGGGGI